MIGMTASDLAPPARVALLDRIVRWNLDTDGDMYGDERERLRWYEGIATAASLQWIGVPWAAAVLVWVLGRPAVLPLAVVLAVMYLPMLLCTAYVRRRRVDTLPRTWSPKKLLVSVLGGLPYVLFVIGVAVAWAPPSLARSMAVGSVVGGVLGAGTLVLAGRRGARREAAAARRAED
jgi:hypothetical protein